jgi:hypothetical protein
MSTERKKRSGEQAETLVMAPMRLAKRAATAGSWGKGEAPLSGGRPPGAVNKITRTMKNAAVAAAEELGRLNTDEWAEHIKLPDPDGMKHYFKVMAVKEMRTFAMFLARIMPLNVATNETQQMLTHQQMLERLKEAGLPIELIHHMRFVDADTLEGAEDESGYFEENPYDFPDDGTTDDEQLRDVTPKEPK